MKPSSESGRDDLRDISQRWIDEELMGARRAVWGNYLVLKPYEMAKYPSTIMLLNKHRFDTQLHFLCNCGPWMMTTK